MLSLFASLLVLVALALCPFWKRDRHFLPLYLWAIYCGLGNVRVFGVAPLSLRWPMGMAFGALGLWWLWRSERRTVDSMVLLGGLFIAWALASAVYSELPQYSFLRAVALIPMYAGAFLGVRALLQEPGGIDRVVLCLVVMIGFQVVLNMAAYGAGSASSFGGRFQGVDKATGTAHHLAYALPFFALLIPWTAGWKRAALWCGAALCCYLLLITRSRTGLAGGLLVAPVAYLMLIRGKRGRQLIAPILTAGVVGAACWILLATDDVRAFLRIESVEATFDTRAGRWERIVAALWDSPWIGHGLGTVRYFAVTGSMTWTLEAGRASQVHTHNEYLSLLYDVGVVPTALFAAFIISVGVRGFACLRAAPSPMSAVLIACFLSWVIDALDTMTHDGLMTIGNPSATWFWIKSLLLYYGYQRAVALSHQYDLVALPPGHRAPIGA